jgi:hypothetical protein
MERTLMVIDYHKIEGIYKMYCSNTMFHLKLLMMRKLVEKMKRYCPQNHITTAYVHSECQASHAQQKHLIWYI